MARFIASVQGGKSTASRCGHRTTGIRSETNGWNMGVKVTGVAVPGSTQDEFRITITGGSNGPSREEGSVHLFKLPGGEFGIRMDANFMNMIARTPSSHEELKPIEVAEPAPLPIKEATLNIDADKITV